MTALSPVLPNTVLDEETIAEITPPCEVDADMPPQCERPAEWIVHATCGLCHDKTISLLCDPHVNDPRIIYTCHACHTSRGPVSERYQRLNRGPA